MTLSSSALLAGRVVSVLTTFYTTYPKDQALPINRLFLKLLEPGMTIQQVHHWLDGLIATGEKYHGK
jgi:hypothetical protein